MSLKIFEYDKYLLPFEDDLELRMEKYEKKLGDSDVRRVPKLQEYQNDKRIMIKGELVDVRVMP